MLTVAALCNIIYACCCDRMMVRLLMARRRGSSDDLRLFGVVLGILLSYWASVNAR